MPVGMLTDGLVPRMAEERGGVIAIVAVALPLLIVLVSLVIDVGNWYEHKRHLQLQADAGALAAGLSYASTCVDDPILVAARRYAGDPLPSGPYSPVSTPPYNTQLTPGGSVRVLLNSPAFFGQAGAADLLDGLPCATKVVDVKVTETGLPLFFGLGTLPAINARARVQLQELESTGGSLPLAVPDTSPSELAVLVVDETTGALLAARKLTRGDETTLNGTTLTQWENFLTPVTVNVPAGSKSIGIVVAASGDPAWKADTDDPVVDDVDDICSQSDVRCYYRPDATTAFRGLVHLRVTAGDADPPAGLPTAPVAREVGLEPLSCPDTSGPSYVLRANCSFRVRAKLDFGATFDPKDASVNLKNDDLGCTGANGCVLSYNATGADAGLWTTPSDSSGSNKVPTIPTNEGPIPISLEWETSVAAGKGKPVVTKGTLANVQRVFSVNSLAEPIEFVRVFKGGIPLTGGSGTTATMSSGVHSLTVAVGVRPSLSFVDETQMLRVASTSGSQTQTLACDGPGAASVLDAIAKGCTTPYQVNDRALACTPAIAPKDCVPVKTGDLTWPQMKDALDARFAPGGVCSPNNWPASGPPTFAANDPDPRIVNLIITTFGAFENQGAANDAPVTGFGTFYVTGWGGSTCSGDKSPAGPNEKYPLGCTAKQASTCGQGDIWGHFFKYIGSFPTGTGSGSACSFTTLGPCVPVLTD